jgi:peptidoglycan/LPS O-acetylase OafA/YrhL
MPETPTAAAARPGLGARSARDNCFDVLRLGAATLVLVSHSFALAGHGEPRLGRSSLGIIGVEIFFAISGFLVTGSWLAQPRVRPFVLKRGLRILPALALTVALSAFVLGPLVSSLSAGAYLRQSGPALYLADNVADVASAGAIRDLAYRLPGVFTGNTSDVVNGSLWTLPVEMRAYLLVLVLGIAGLLLRRLWIVVAAMLLLLAAPASASGWTGVGGVVRTLRDAHPLDLQMLAIFGVSALLYVYRDRVPLRPWLAAAALATWVISTWAPAHGALVALAVPYLVIYAAYEAPKALLRLTRPGDVSYGLYLLAFPVQQTIVHLAGRGAIEPLALVAIAFPVTYLLALLSWRLVERPALSLKRVVRRPEPPGPLARPAAVTS